LARDEEGAQLDAVELRDQLMTLLMAGHETTATGLAWAFERLLRNPDALRRLTLELALGREEYLGWTIEEALRVRPVIPFVLRFLTEPYEVGGYVAPAESLLAVSISLIHRRADLYPEPERFLPERFEEGSTESFAWLPFSGGVRRCLGAPFAIYEMRVVLSRVFERCELVAPDPRPERPRRRGVTFVPHRGALVEMRRR
jgi:cytochrome P450